MPKIKDIRGQKFGRLTVLERVESNVKYKTSWLCKCDCGNEKIVLRCNLINGNTRSCGCLVSEFYEKKAEDLSNQKFGRLTVIERAVYQKENRVYWLCKCDCGNKKVAQARRLKSGEVQSCGCIAKEVGLERIKTMREKALYVGRYKGTKIGNISSHIIPKNNTSGVKGVSWAKDKLKWHVYIELKGKRKNLGYFLDLETAIVKRKEAEEIYYSPIIKEYKSTN